MKKNLTIVSIIFLTGLVFTGCTKNTPDADLTNLAVQESEDGNTNSGVVVIENESSNKVAEYVLTAEQDGQTAYQLLQSKADVSALQYDFGVYIESINDLAGDGQHFWAFYVNNELAKQGADKTVLKKGDKVKFTYEEVESSMFVESEES